jgi:hypothetical protein
MPRKRKPKYALHKAIGQARIRLSGKDDYLGTYDSEESHLKYEELVGRWLANQELDSSSLRCDRLALLYIDYAKGYYRKNGKQTVEVHAVRVVMRHLVKVHGNTLCSRFGPKDLRPSVFDYCLALRDGFRDGVFGRLCEFGEFAIISGAAKERQQPGGDVEWFCETIQSVQRNLTLSVFEERDVVDRQAWTARKHGLRLLASFSDAFDRLAKPCRVNSHPHETSKWLVLPDRENRKACECPFVGARLSFRRFDLADHS